MTRVELDFKLRSVVPFQKPNSFLEYGFVGVQFYIWPLRLLVSLQIVGLNVQGCCASMGLDFQQDV